ncbi:MAG TPA: hypothetical protein VFV41_09070 [Streptosporangiaceae bacterium]|nr:hypothetical protein [Streptosporangiaceae bacterium]
MIGNLAWAPPSAFQDVEVIDRFNGVPTMGLFGAPGERILFWRALGYGPASDISAWVYVPLNSADEEHLACTVPSELLRRLVFAPVEQRRLTIGLASDYRLFVEFDWSLPARSPAGLLSSIRSPLQSAKRAWRCKTSCLTLASMPETITIRTDAATEHALDVLTGGGLSRSAAVRQALLEAAARRERAAELRSAVLQMDLGPLDGINVADELSRAREEER